MKTQEGNEFDEINDFFKRLKGVDKLTEELTSKIKKIFNTPKRKEMEESMVVMLISLMNEQGLPLTKELYLSAKAIVGCMIAFWEINKDK